MTLPSCRQNRGPSPLRPAEFFGGEFRLFPDLISFGLSGGISRIDSRVGVIRRSMDSSPICFTRRESTLQTPTPLPFISFFMRFMNRFARSFGYEAIHRFTGRSRFIEF